MTTAEQLERTVSADALVVPARPDDVATGAPSTPRPDRGRLTTVAVVLATLSPFFVGAYAIIQRGFPPGALFGDRAILALNAIDAWRAPVLLGPYSRFYWHHPGPLYFYVLNAWSTVFGNGTVALVLGAVSVNVAATAGILVVAHRRGGRSLMVWASLLLTAYLVAIEPIPFDIWNPSVTLLPFVLVLLLAWSVASRDWWSAPWLALVASFAVQTHVGLVPGVATAVGFSVVAAVVRQRRREVALDDAERTTVRRSLLASALVAVVVWLPPVIEELTSRTGNLTALAHFFTRPGSPHTLSEGITNTGLQATLMLRAVYEPISIRIDGHQGLAVAVVVSAMAFVVAVVAARKARAHDVVALLLLVALELVVGVYGVTRIVGPIQFYLVQWISAVGFVLWLGVGDAVLQFMRTRLGGTPSYRTLSRVTVVVVLALLCVSTIRALPSGAGLVNEDLDVPNNRDLFGYVPAAQLLSATRKGETVVLRNDSVTAWEVLAADALLLEQHGRTVKIVEAQETNLLFDDAMLVPSAGGAHVLAFRDRDHPHLRGTDTLLARQGKWSIVDIDSR